jgi:membrane protein YdbS with pleckstrin-like domain
MENERAKEKKQVWRNFMWAAMFLLILLFAAMGILFYILLSHDTEKLLLLIVSILSLAALFTWIFRYRPAFKIYRREYKVELEMVEKSRAFKVSLFLLIFLGFVIGWYFAHQAGFTQF